MMLRMCTPAVGIGAVALVAFLSLASGGGSPVGLGLLVVLAVGGVALTRARTRAAGTGTSIVVERVGGCGLGPGIAVHAIRVSGRVLVVGVSGSNMALLDRVSDDEVDVSSDGELAVASDTPAAADRSTPAWLQRALLIVVVSLGIVAPAGNAAAAQAESPRQSADLAQGARPESETSGPPRELAPPLIVPAETGVELPNPGPIPLGPMMWLAGLAVLPFALMGLTSFVKISVVLSLLRSALGTPQVPSDPLLAGIALALTTFVMAPVANEAWARIGAANVDLSTASGVFTAATAAAPPIRGFLERNARPDEIALFVSLSARDGREAADPGSFGILVPAFITSELREAFVAGFFLFIPFLVVDLVVSNILMSMGMVMVSPTTVSLPFKILLFVLIDGWPLLAKALALSYH